ncbi:MAG: hypothetical protein J0L80_15730, partial [Chitinophagales bacterium]|nr:hypothetical protein [Chitinophagales bacterium]
MRKLVTLILLLTCFLASAQNMVPNGDFEYYTSCPTSLSQAANCTGWRAYHGGSSDYYNTCATGGAGVPANLLGWQLAASGNGYGGVFIYNGSTTNYKEYLARQITPLTIGAMYEVSMSVSLADTNSTTSNDLSVWFYDNGPTTTVSGSANLATTPKISYISYGAITNKTNWTRLVGYFTADSAYDNIIIGGALPYTSMNFTSVSGGGGSYSNMVYYYIDSVVVKLATGINNLYADSMICAGDTFQVPYTINNVNNFNSGNVFSVQLSNASGSFASGTTTIGT